MDVMDIMEKKMKKQSDYQRFENDESLAKIIRETERRCGAAMTD